MPDFISTLANMYAQAKPQFQVQQGRPTVLPFMLGNTKTGGMGDVGEALGKGIGEGITKTYTEPQQELYKQKLMWDNDPKMVEMRIQSITSAYHRLPPDKQKVLYKQKEVQTLLDKGIRMGIPASVVADEEDGKEYYIPAGGPTKEQQEAVTLQGMPIKPIQAGVNLQESETGLRKSQAKEVDVDTLTKDLAYKNAQKISAANFPFLSALADLKNKEAQPALTEAQTGQAISASNLHSVQANLAPIHAARELAAAEGANKRIDLEIERVKLQESKTEEERTQHKEKIRGAYFKDWTNRDIDVDKANRGVVGTARSPRLEATVLTQKAANLKGLIDGLTQELGEGDAVTHTRTIDATTRTIDQAFNILSKAQVGGAGHKVVSPAETEALVSTVEEVVRSMAIIKEGEKGPEWRTDVPPTAIAKLAWMKDYLEILRNEVGQGTFDFRKVNPQPLDYYLKLVGQTPRITNKGGKK